MTGGAGFVLTSARPWTSTPASLTFDGPDGAVVLASAASCSARDGAYSAVGGGCMTQAGLRLQQDYLDHGYKELTLPPVDGDFALTRRPAHLAARQSMMIALPNPDRSSPARCSGPGRSGELRGDRLPRGRSTSTSPGTTQTSLTLMPDLEEDYDANPVGSLLTVRCLPWQANGRVALIGDAAHAIVPFYGQGANCALRGLCRARPVPGGDAVTGRRRCRIYQDRRKANAEAIADMALDNFVEMRDRTASPIFQATREYSTRWSASSRSTYSTRYELVSFSTVPYAEVVRRTSPTGQAASIARGALSAVRSALGRANLPEGSS